MLSLGQYPRKIKLWFLFGLLVVALAFLFFAVRNYQKTRDFAQGRTGSDQKSITAINDEKKKELTEQSSLLEQSLQNIEINDPEDPNKINILIALAFTSAQLRQAEAKDYAKKALELFGDESLKDENNQGLLKNLTEIANGDNESYIRAVNPES